MEPAAFAVGSASTLDAEAAIKVYLAKASCSPRDGTTAALAKQYNITMKAVRDVWNLRTWTWSTMPYWTYSDQKKFLRQHLCIHCRIKGVTSLASACKTCATPRRRGRRPVQTPGRELLSSDAAESTLTEAFANDLPNMTPPQDYAQEDAGLPRNLLRMLPHAAHVYVSHCDAANIPPGRGQLWQNQGAMRSSRQQFAFEDYEARSFSMQPSAAYFCSTIVQGSCPYVQTKVDPGDLMDDLEVPARSNRASAPGLSLRDSTRVQRALPRQMVDAPSDIYPRYEEETFWDQERDYRYFDNIPACLEISGSYRPPLPPPTWLDVRSAAAGPCPGRPHGSMPSAAWCVGRAPRRQKEEWDAPHYQEDAWDASPSRSRPLRCPHHNWQTSNDFNMSQVSMCSRASTASSDSIFELLSSLDSITESLSPGAR
jgi:hypothetical protein